MKKIKTLILFMMLTVGACALTATSAKAAVKLSTKKVTFSKPSTGSKTITIKGVKASNIKKLTVTPGNKMIAKATKKSKNKFVIKAGYAGETYVSVNATYKKPVKGSYGFYGSVTVKVKGKSEIPIKTAKDLTQIQEYNEKWTYVLKNDIDAKDLSLPLKNKWNDHISLQNTTLDGKGHVIKNLNGPFLQCLGGTLKNVKFENFNIKCKNTDTTDLRREISKGNAAALIQSASIAKISNCKVSGNIELIFIGEDKFEITENDHYTQLDYVGGLVGRNQSICSIEKCVSDVDILLDYRESTAASRCPKVGGICGENSGNEDYPNTIKECENLGDIETYSGNCYVGGITGSTSNAVYENCLNAGKIFNHDYYSHEAEVTSAHYAGLISWNNSTSTWKNCLNAGTVGYGINGYPIDQSYDNWGKYENVYNAEDKTVSMFYYLQDPFVIPGTHNISGADMTNQSAFAGFDFDKIWTMGEHGPELKNVYK